MGTMKTQNKLTRIMPGLYRFEGGQIRQFTAIDYQDLPIYNQWIIEWDNGDFSDTYSTLRAAKFSLSVVVQY